MAFLLLVVFPILLNLYADRIIGRTLSEIVSSETGGKYVLSFEKVGLNVFSREISFEGVNLQPDSVWMENDSVNLKSIGVPELHLKGASWLRSFWKRELIIEEFWVENPAVHYSGIIRHQPDSLKVEKSFDHRKLHTHIESYIDILKIESFRLNKGSFVLELDNGGIEERLEVHDFSIAVNHFHLDSISHQNQEKLFFSDSLGLQLDDGRFYYQKGPLNIRFAHLEVSSVSDEIHLRSASISQLKDSVNVLEFKIPGLIIKGFDPTTIMESRIIDLKEITFIRTGMVLNLHHQTGKGGFDPGSFATELYKAVSENFERVKIGRIKFENAGLLIPGEGIKGLEQFNLPDFDLTLIRLLIDPATFEQRKDFLFLDDFLLISHGQDLSLREAGFDISYSSLSVNTALSRIRLDGVNLDKTAGDPNDKLRVNVAELKILGRDFKSDFLNRSIDLKSFVADGLSVELQRIKTDSPNKIDLYDLYPLISDHLKFIQISDIEFRNSKVNILAGEQIEDATWAKGELDLHFYDFQLDKSSRDSSRMLYSSGIEFNGKNLDVNIPKAGHALVIDQLRMDTRTSDLVINQLKIDTLKGFPHKLPLLLNAASVEAFGVDYQNFYFRQEYFIDSVQLENPAITLFLPDSANKRAGNQTEPTTSYYFGNVGISNGKLDVLKQVGKGRITEIGNFDLALNNLEQKGDKPGFSQIEATIRNIDIPIRNSWMEAYVERIELSSTDSLMIVKGVNFLPVDSAIQKNPSSVRFELPILSLHDFPVIDFYEDNTISAGKMLLDKPSVLVIHNNAPRKIPFSFVDFDPTVIKPVLLKQVSAFSIDSIMLSNGSVALEIIGDTASNYVYAEGLNLSVLDFDLDEQTTMSQSNLMFASDIQIAVDSIIRLSETSDKLTLEDFKLTTAGQNLSIESINYIAREKAVKGSSSKMNMGSLSTSGLDYYGLVIDKRIRLDRLDIDRPDLIFNRKPQGGKPSGATSQPLDLYEMIAGHFHEIQANDISLSDIRLKITDDNQPRKGAYLFEQIDFRLKNILVDSTQRIFGNRFLYSDDLDFAIRQFRETSADSLYDFGAANIRYSSSDAILKIDSGFLQPNYSDSVFAARVGVQTDRLEFVFDSLKFTNFHIVDFLTNRNLQVDKAELDNLAGDDFRSKAYPFPENHYPKLPASALKSLDYKVRVDTFIVRNSSFKYREYRPPALQPGEIWFTEINLQGRNITNDTSKIARDSLMGFNASARLMGEAGLDLNLAFNLKKDNDFFKANGVLNHIDMTALNPILEHVAFVKVTKGYNEMLTFDFQANNDLSRGDMDFKYRKMHIRLIDKETLQTRGFGESIASFIANTFVVRRNNPKLILFFRDGEIYFPRDKQKSFFNYLTKSALSGVKTTIRGGNEERREKRRKRQMERQLRKEGKLDDAYMNDLNEGK